MSQKSFSPEITYQNDHIASTKLLIRFLKFKGIFLFSFAFHSGTTANPNKYPQNNN